MQKIEGPQSCNPNSHLSSFTGIGGVTHEEGLQDQAPDVTPTLLNIHCPFAQSQTSISTSEISHHLCLSGEISNRHNVRHLKGPGLQSVGTWNREPLWGDSRWAKTEAPKITNHFWKSEPWFPLVKWDIFPFLPCLFTLSAKWGPSPHLSWHL